MTTESGLIVPSHATRELLTPHPDFVVPQHVLPDNLEERAPELTFGDVVEVEGEGERFRIMTPLHNHRAFGSGTNQLFGSHESVNENPAPEVYVAYDTETGEDVALKILYEPDSVTTSLVDRELAAHALLSGQDGFVETVDMGILEKDDGRHRFVATKLNPTGTLGDLLKKEGPLDPSEALRVGIQVVRSAAIMNEQGMVHGDIKPDNILLTPDDTVEFTDMGTVRIAKEKRELIARQMGLTGILKPLVPVGTGSRGYAAPESITDPNAIDERTDTFGAAATLYRIATGSTPHVMSGDIEDYLRRVQNDPIISAHMYNKGIPHTVSETLRDGLDPIQANRPTPSELQTMLTDHHQELQAA